jgi:sugar lactone lactonase YvrE
MNAKASLHNTLVNSFLPRCLQAWVIFIVTALLMACGGSGGGDVALAPILTPILIPPTPKPTGISLYLGSMGGDGDLDGTVVTARFNNPGGVAVDGAGNVYVADTGNHSIRKISVDGTVTTWAGKSGDSGSVDGLGAAARFTSPNGIALDAVGNIYVADRGNHLIRKISPAGQVSTLAGSAGEAGLVDGIGAAARLSYPTRLALGPNGLLYVVDTQTDVVRTVDASGQVGTMKIDVPRGTEIDANTGAITRYDPYFSGIAVDRSGNVLLPDRLNRIVYRITPSGSTSTVYTGIPVAREWYLYNQELGLGDIVIDAGGNVSFIDSGSIRRLSATGEISTIDLSNSLSGPAALAVDHGGALFIAYKNTNIAHITGSGASAVLRVGTDGTITRLAPVAAAVKPVDDSGASVDLRPSGSLSVAPDGALFLADFRSGRVHQLGAGGLVTTRPMVPDLARQGLDAIYGATGLAIDGAGNAYLAHYFGIYKVSAAGVVSLLAGVTGGSEFLPPDISSVLNAPVGIVASRDGVLYVSDRGDHTIRKITPQGVVTTVAGLANESGSADGNGSAARFNQPSGLALDALGNLYVADSGNKTVRKIMPTGLVSTIAGRAGFGGDEDGADATFLEPRYLAVDAAGAVYVAELNKRLLRKISPTGFVSTVAGQREGKGIRAGALPGYLGVPTGLAVGLDGTVYYATDGAILALQL